jgi:hypothetical protein
VTDPTVLDRASYERVVRWAARHYPSLWRNDEAAVRSAVGLALATRQRTEWVLNDEVKYRGRECRWDGKVTLEYDDGRSMAGGSTSAPGVEWSDPTGETAAGRVDAANALASVHPDYRQVMWMWAEGGTPSQVADALGLPVATVENIVYGRVDRARRAKTAAQARHGYVREMWERGTAEGRSLRRIAADAGVSVTHLRHLVARWTAELEPVAA